MPRSPSPSRHLAEKEFEEVWHGWKLKLSANNEKPIDAVTEESQLYELEGFSTEEAIAIVRYSTSRTKCNNLITNGDHKRSRPPKPKVEEPKVEAVAKNTDTPERKFLPRSKAILELHRQQETAESAQQAAQAVPSDGN